ncbi:MAG: thiamine phosphate synthase [Oscillospiraceae bacterium]|nr:thiamine phosphate synthase [Oscillospiraceae bacterium]
MRFDPTLYFITDSTGMNESEFFNIIAEALRGGVTLVQLREKEKSTRAYIDLAREVHRLTEKYNVPLIIDDRVDVAYAAEAEGVHLGAEDMPINTARKILGKDKIIGATAKTTEQAKKAETEGANYLGVGAIYPTTTKVKTVLTSIETLSRICREVKIPVNAIGGLDADNIGVLDGIGISGVCVVSAIMKAERPFEAAYELGCIAGKLVGKRGIL